MVCGGAVGLALTVSLTQSGAAQDSAAQDSAAEDNSARDTAAPVQPAQDAAPPQSPAVPQDVVVPSPILTIDQDRLFAASRFGQRALRDLETASAALADENRSIEARLAEEERDLTVRRATLPPDEFRTLADDFDTRVEAIRTAQDKKAADLSQFQDGERKRFFAAALPVLGDIVRASGAVAVLDSRAIFLSADRIDVTDRAITIIDKVIGEGTPPPGTQPGVVPGTPPGVVPGTQAEQPPVSPLPTPAPPQAPPQAPTP